MKQLADYFVFLVCRLLFAAIQAISIETAQRISRPLVWLAVDVLRIRHDVLDENLRHAFPQLRGDAVDRLARRHWEHLFLMIIEIAHAERKIHLTNWRNYIRFRARRELMQHLLSDRPTVLLSGHFGNFEVGGQVLGKFGIPTFTIARPLDNPYLDRFINSFRSANGQSILPKKGSSKIAEQSMNDGVALVVLGDQAAGRKGIWVDFFGRPASTHKAMALYSLSYEAPMVVTYTQRLKKPMTFEVGCEASVDPASGAETCRDVRQLTVWYTKQLETAVRRAPEQYWWLHRRWKHPTKWRRRKIKNKRAA
ncbi:MAG: lysophospholipid acyltransferase family protein [Pirellulales bacterium]